MNYDKYFDMDGKATVKKVPRPALSADGGKKKAAEQATRDRRDGSVYVFNEKIELAVNVALATGRPLLVRGTSGSGKSSLARSIARRLGWRYYEQVITSRTQARDLLSVFDSLRRLGDAQAEKLDEDNAHYVDPGPLWWAFDPSSAARRGRPEKTEDGAPTIISDPAEDPGKGPEGEGAVVLLDEIDKADPDVPNNLLVPLGSFEFGVRETGAAVAAARPLMIVITTNDERVLPAAFMRRCVVLKLDAPDVPLLVKIAREHFGPDKKRIYKPVAARVVKISSEASDGARAGSPPGQQPAASTAEYLDTVRACLDLDINPSDDDEEWQSLIRATLAKSQNPD